MEETMQVIETNKTIIAYELRYGIGTKLTLWLKVKCQDWDTNTGTNDGKEYTKWEKARKLEVLEYLRRKNGKDCI